MEDPAEEGGISSDVPRRIRTLDHKFRRACDQIMLLNNRIDDMQSRYNSAMKLNRRSFRYSLRLKLATLEGIRNMFYEYASRCADNLEELQVVLLGDADDSTDSVEMNGAVDLYEAPELEDAASDRDFETSDASLDPFVYDDVGDSGSVPSSIEDNDAGSLDSLHAGGDISQAVEDVSETLQLSSADDLITVDDCVASPGSSGPGSSNSISSSSSSNNSGLMSNQMTANEDSVDMESSTDAGCERAEEDDDDTMTMHAPSLQDSGISDV